jgi:hypothetical protein
MDMDYFSEEQVRGIAKRCWKEIEAQIWNKGFELTNWPLNSLGVSQQDYDEYTKNKAVPVVRETA